MEGDCRSHFDGQVNEEESERRLWASRVRTDVQPGSDISDEDGGDTVGSDDLHY